MHSVVYQPGDEALKANSIGQLCWQLAPLGDLSRVLNGLVSTFERLREGSVVSWFLADLTLPACNARVDLPIRLPAEPLSSH